MADDRTIGALVQSIRTDKGLSQADLLRQLEERGLTWHQTTLARVEAGTRALKASELFVLADALEVKPQAFNTVDIRRSALVAQLDAVNATMRQVVRSRAALEAELSKLDEA